MPGMTRPKDRMAAVLGALLVGGVILGAAVPTGMQRIGTMAELPSAETSRSRAASGDVGLAGSRPPAQTFTTFPAVKSAGIRDFHPIEPTS